jgi:inorganic pyrophosphatase
MADQSFWNALDQLLAGSQVVIDRPKGSPHPRYPDLTYPLDYGYLAGTMSVDGGGIDVWVGSVADKETRAVICTVDLLKRDVEVKILLGCSEAEVEAILRFVEASSMGCTLLRRLTKDDTSP